MSDTNHADGDLNGNSSVRESAARTVRSVKSGAVHVAHEARSAVEDVGETLGETWDEIAGDVTDIVGEARESSVDWIRRHPFGAVASAAAAGWLIAKVFSRR
ncbi:MAG: hypothetical protein ABI411_06270 [Tahibacter sp.]